MNKKTKFLSGKVLISLLVFTSLLTYCSDAKESNTEEKKEKIELGKALINNSDCNSCHQLDAKIIGPSYLEIAGKYENNSGNIQKLAEKIIKGGSGSWGEIPMLAHADLDDQDAQAMALYILSLPEQE